MKIFFAGFILIFSIVAAFAQKSDLPIITETKPITGAELKSLVKPKDKKPILLNFWATWCGPCRSEFPELIEIDKDYRAKNLNFYLVSVDDFAVIDTRVPEFLQDYESTMPSYLINLESRTQIARAVRQIAPRFPDTYPLTLLFDGNGRLVFQKSGRVDTKILRKEIDKVLPKIDSQVSAKVNEIPNKKEIVVQLTPFGYMSLPKGYWAYMEADYMDAWGGIIETLDGSFKIRFSDGLMVSVFDGKKLKWKKQINAENGIITYAVTNDKKSKNLLAKIGSANFSAKIKDESEIETFLDVIKRFRKGKCEDCFSSTMTKRLRKFFERN